MLDKLHVTEIKAFSVIYVHLLIIIISSWVNIINKIVCYNTITINNLIEVAKDVNGL